MYILKNESIEQERYIIVNHVVHIVGILYG